MCAFMCVAKAWKNRPRTWRRWIQFISWWARQPIGCNTNTLCDVAFISIANNVLYVVNTACCVRRRCVPNETKITPQWKRWQGRMWKMKKRWIFHERTMSGELTCVCVSHFWHFNALFIFGSIQISCNACNVVVEMRSIFRCVFSFRLNENNTHFVRFLCFYMHLVCAMMLIFRLVAAGDTHTLTQCTQVNSIL